MKDSTEQMSGHTHGHNHGHGAIDHNHPDHDRSNCAVCCGHSHGEGDHSFLGWAFEQIGSADDSWLQNYRKPITLAAAGALAAYEYGTLGALSTSGQLAMIFGSAVLAHDAAEDLMDSIGELKHSHNINGTAIGMAVGAAHTSSELLMSAFATSGNYQNLAVATTMGSNVSHILVTVGAAAAAGTVAVNKFSAHAIDTAAIIGTTGAFAYQVATGEFNPWLCSAMVAGSLGHLYWRLKAGDTRIQIDSEGKSVNDFPKLSDVAASAKDTIKRIPQKSVEHLNAAVRFVKDRLSLISVPKAKQIYAGARSIARGATHSNIATAAASLTAVGLSTHVLGNNVVKMAETEGYTATAMGATVAALAFVLPELYVTTRAAMKNHGDVAWGAITGCTVATVGIVGAYQGLSGFEIPDSLNLAYNEGKLQMGVFVGSAIAAAAVTHPTLNKRFFAKSDNAAADFLENKFPRVSNWLRNDGTKISKTVAVPMLASALAFYAAALLPICHSHGTWTHCIERAPVDLPLPSAEESRDALQRALPQATEGPGF